MIAEQIRNSGNRTIMIECGHPESAWKCDHCLSYHSLVSDICECCLGTKRPSFVPRGHDRHLCLLTYLVTVPFKCHLRLQGNPCILSEAGWSENMDTISYIQDAEKQKRIKIRRESAIFAIFKLYSSLELQNPGQSFSR